MVRVHSDAPISYLSVIPEFYHLILNGIVDLKHRALAESFSSHFPYQPTLVQEHPTRLSTFLSTSKRRLSPRTTGKVSLQQVIFNFPGGETFQALEIQALTLQNMCPKVPGRASDFADSDEANF